MNKNQTKLSLRSPQDIDLIAFNKIRSLDNKGGKPVKDLKRLFYKDIIIDDERLITSETIINPGFIGIADEVLLNDSEGKIVSGHEDIIKFLERDGLLICTYQSNKDRYGKVIDLRYPPNEDEVSELMEIFIKNEGHHSGAIIPALRNGNQAFASFNEPDSYHKGLFGDKGFIAVAQRLVFPDFVSQEQAHAYTNSIICWMALMNSFVQFTDNNFNGGDPTGVFDRRSLKQFMQNCVLASLGSNDAIEFLNKSENKTYCAEFIYIALNTLIYPFNKAGITSLLDGNEAQALEILELQNRHNNKRETLLSILSKNPQFKYFNISMPIVLENLPPLDFMMIENGHNIESNSISFPPLTLSQLLRRAFKTLLPRHKNINNNNIIKAQSLLLKYLKPLIFLQLEIHLDPSDTKDPKTIAIDQFLAFIEKQISKKYENYEDFDYVIDRIMKKADDLIGSNNVNKFVPPRIYVDLGQNDGDENLPSGWGFKLETIGTLIHRGVIRSN